MAYSFDQIAKFKRGEEYFESNQHHNVKFRVITEPEIDGDELRFIGRNLQNDREIKFLFNRKFMHYGPKIYDHPAYSCPNDLAGWGQ